MRLKKYVLSIFGEGIKRHGFVFDSSLSGDGAWCFLREVKDINQMISVVKYRWAKSLQLTFNTSAYGFNFADAQDLVPEGKYRLAATKKNEFRHFDPIPDVGAPYDDEEDVKLILQEFVEIVKEYGLAELEKLSNDGVKARPTGSMAKKLISSYESLNKDFINRHNLSTEGCINSNAREWFKLIKKLISDCKSKPYEETQELLVEIAAFLGVQMQNELGGEWKYNSFNHNAALLGLKSKSMVYSPLSDIVNYWAGNKTAFEDPEAHFFEILNSRNHKKY